MRWQQAESAGVDNLDKVPGRPRLLGGSSSARVLGHLRPVGKSQLLVRRPRMRQTGSIDLARPGANRLFSSSERIHLCAQCIAQGKPT
jgi:hypothetical protein